MDERIRPGFRFSQSSLAAFAACRRRFFLRYVRRLPWPAAPQTSDPWETALERGRRFHEWIQQEALGLEMEEIVAACGDSLLQKWWWNFRHRPPQGIPAGQIFSEVELEAPMGDFRLLARFDRVVLGIRGGIVAIDWKTGERRPEGREYLESWQTRVYRYVLVEAGKVLRQDQKVEPEEIRLVYWHAQYPEILSSIPYSHEEHQAVGQTLASTIAEIAVLSGEADFPLTGELEECRRCRFCAYCGRAIAPILEEVEWVAEEQEAEEDQLSELEAC